MNRKIIRVVIIFCLVISAPVLQAQSGSPDLNEKNAAILVRGPVQSMGFPLLYPNAIETWSGYYRYLGLEVVVSFTREDILIPDEWESAGCSESEGFSPDGSSFFYKDNDWSLLFQFPSSLPVGAPLAGALSVDRPDCLFINKYITRLKYFLRNAPPHEPPLLPAILEF